MLGDTIAAIATGPVPAALGIVRISGPAAAAVLAAVVPNARAIEHPRRVSRGHPMHPRTGRRLDDVLCFFAPGPGTATGEDAAEIHGHGGPVVLRALLDAAIAAGARAAEPGEFTARAFRNGRMDLTQAEAVMGLVSARSERAARVALRQLGGGIAARLEGDYEALTRIAASLEAALDFPDEDLPSLVASSIAGELAAIAASLERLSGTFGAGARVSNGAAVTLVGPPNAGKSSLLNRLAGSDRAIVDPEPGTTRDVLEVEIALNGVPFRLADTAGLRQEPGRLEELGISRALAAAGAADLVVAVVDGATDADDPDALDALFRGAGGLPRPVIAAINKCDLPGWRADRFSAALESARRIGVSALTGAGCDELARAIGDALADEEIPDEVVLTTARQHEAVSSAEKSVREAAARLEHGDLPELAAADLRFAREALASLAGRNADADALDAVFSSFCLGK
ncbi:MAG: tRNA uridine-5-carboxymethylaminomethyl(34) synthesis GTPase MnmE [Proteobacteria bacterium]|nr:tRNA uridine-5-carboxymethylaminomethyl(34) synthesis GTPase MnmE [Pseudomonadota bacterium]